jgi:hypothetical protein
VWGTWGEMVSCRIGSGFGLSESVTAIMSKYFDMMAARIDSN